MNTMHFSPPETLRTGGNARNKPCYIYALVFISVAWSVYGAGLLIAAFRLGHASLRKLAMATLLLVVIKLFIVDLSRIAAIWRVLISLGLGGMFLLLSYYLPGMWRGKKED